MAIQSTRVAKRPRASTGSRDTGDLAGTTWTLLQFATGVGVIPALPEAPATLAFAARSEPGAGGSGAGGEPVNRISGSGASNRYVGSYTLTGNHLKLSPLGATRMMCAPERMAQEERFFQAIETADSCELRDGQLLITYVGGRLRFEPAAMSQSS
jgi:META domain